MSEIFRMALCGFFILMSGYVQAAEQWDLSSDKSKVEFIVHSTLHEVHGEAQEMSGSFNEESSAVKGSVEVGVLGLTTDNTRRDSDMYQMFDIARYPQIYFVFDSVDMTSVLNQHEGKNVTFKGVMTIHNISHSVTLLSKAHLQNNQLICEGQTRIHLKDYDLKPPSVLGLIRVSNEVDVHYTIVFINKGSV